MFRRSSMCLSVAWHFSPLAITDEPHANRTTKANKKRGTIRFEEITRTFVFRDQDFRVISFPAIQQ